MFWVHGIGRLGDGAEQRIGLAHPDWRLTDGQPPPAAAYDVLVAGRPDETLLDASPRLHTLVVPYAGVPTATRRLLDARPRIAVRTLHHTAGPTAELAVALTLAAARAVLPADAAMRRGDWSTRFDPPRPTMVLGGSAATVVGYGEVGRRVARTLAALDMEVRAIRASTASRYEDGPVSVHPVGELPLLLPDSRVLVLAIPATPATERLIGGRELDMLPRPAVLVNVARATVVDEAALYDRLRHRELAAGLDVWWNEAGGADSRTDVVASQFPFHELPNVVLSPHRGGGFSLPEVRELRLAHLDRLLTELAGSFPPEPRSVWR
jgi:phosphoglycerate dehydrogenase-like enzyme